MSTPVQSLPLHGGVNDATIASDPPETVTLAPMRGGVSVELVAIVWELV